MAEKEAGGVATDLNLIPLIRHGSPETQDPQLSEILREAEVAHTGTSEALRSMYLLEGPEIWVTWSTARDRARFSGPLTDICRRKGFNVRHLVPVDEQYDYQEDVPLLV